MVASNHLQGPIVYHEGLVFVVADGAQVTVAMMAPEPSDEQKEQQQLPKWLQP